MEPRALYTVRGVAPKGTVTYNCPSPEWAVRKYRDLTGQGLSDVTITGPEGQALTLADLEAASDEMAVPAACVPVHHS